MKWLVSLLSIVLIEVYLYSQSGRIVFWNVENAFDTINHPLKQDDEFTPSGTRNWSSYKYWRKINHLAQVIGSIGEWEAPMLIGLCEVENRSVLYDLCQHPALKKIGYQIIHEETADARGIDPAFLYNPNLFTVVKHGTIPLIYENDSLRHILWVQGKTYKGDTLFAYMHHWPSKYSGAITTIPKRKLAAEAWMNDLSEKRKHFPNAIFMGGGDFNDEFNDESVQYFMALAPYMECKSSKLIGGTHKFREHWSLIDMIFVNREWGPKSSSEAMIFNHEKLLIPDENYSGEKPFRTYNGFKYLGGYSDHLPIYIDLYK